MRLADLHNIINHFSIALLNIGILFEFGGALFKNEGLRTFSWNALRLAAGFAVLSLISGFAAQQSVAAMTEEALEVVTYHKTFGYLVVALVAATVILRMMAKDAFDAEATQSAIRGAYYTLLILTFVTTSISTFLGMELTYSHGVNVRPYERILEALPPKVDPNAPAVPLDTTLTR